MVRALPLVLLALVACGKKNSPESAVTPVELVKNAVEAPTRELPRGLVLEEIDLDENGRPDIYNRWSEVPNAPRVLKQRQSDLNLDGRVDVVTWFDDAGHMEFEELDLDFDGKIDCWDTYATDAIGTPVRVKSEWDTDYDGRPNVITTFRDGVRVEKVRDLDGDGAMDHWERFDAEGKVESGDGPPPG